MAFLLGSFPLRKSLWPLCFIGSAFVVTIFMEMISHSLVVSLPAQNPQTSAGVKGLDHGAHRSLSGLGWLAGVCHAWVGSVEEREPSPGCVCLPAACLSAWVSLLLGRAGTEDML